MIQISELHAGLAIISGAVFYFLSIYLAHNSGYKQGRLGAMAENDRKNRPDCPDAWKSAPMSQTWNEENDPQLRGSLPFEKPKLDKFEPRSITSTDRFEGPRLTESTISKE